MRNAKLSLSVVFALGAAGCPTAGAGVPAADSGVSSASDARGNESAPGDANGENDAGAGLHCVHGGTVGHIEVAFDCTAITIYSCKDISNVVLDFSDGSTQRYQGGMKQIATLNGSGGHAGKVLAGVWVKAGDNKSGDGPGYGERFDAPDDTCDHGAAGHGGGAGTWGGAGAGGTSGSAGAGGCSSDAPDNACDGSGQPPAPPPADYCAAHPNDPACSPD